MMNKTLINFIIIISFLLFIVGFVGMINKSFWSFLVPVATGLYILFIFVWLMIFDLKKSLTPDKKANSFVSKFDWFLHYYFSKLLLKLLVLAAFGLMIVTNLFYFGAL